LGTRSQISVEGIVQGVGFRPFIYRLATGLGLKGWVTNTSIGVVIEVEGPAQNLKSFLASISDEAPPLASITSLTHIKLPQTGYEDFSIRPSLANADPSVLVSPDTCICSDCRRELLDPGDRRYRYPFINCTNCGPRYSIIRSVPYDRKNTSMDSFIMCSSCQSEYDDPSNRRFHAQPNACFDCGPGLDLINSDGSSVNVHPLVGTIRMIRDGKIVAVKGLGGFHLVVDPMNGDAVKNLRMRKGRDEKPFALMVRDVETAGKLCQIDDVAKEILLSTESPIALLPRETDPDLQLAREVAPASRYYGLMLPYTPLHTLLMEEFDVLVMTSANMSEEPLCAENHEALERLSSIADAYLFHDREIVLRCDDSIVRLAPAGMDEGPVVLRRARGFVPAPVLLPVGGDPILALGPELKGSICITRGDRAFIGQHLGDLKNLETADFLKEVVGHLMDILDVTPSAIVCDLHPDYLTTYLATEDDDVPWPAKIPVLRVQHHHAHILSSQAESGLSGPTLGLALDGTGYGTDGTIWGGEILFVNGTKMNRIGNLRPVWMPGGERAIEKPYRMAVSYLVEALGADEGLSWAEKLFPGLEDELGIVSSMVSTRNHGIFTSSTGRLFDSFSAMLGICLETRYEGQAAIELEVLTDSNVTDTLPYSVQRDGDDRILVDMLPSFVEAAQMRITGREISVIAGMFHKTLARAFSEAILSAYEDQPEIADLNTVSLGGGVFQNEIFSTMIIEEMRSIGIEPVFHRKVPTNDGGVSLGQAVYGILAQIEEV